MPNTWALRARCSTSMPKQRRAPAHRPIRLVRRVRDDALCWAVGYVCQTPAPIGYYCEPGRLAGRCVGCPAVSFLRAGLRELREFYLNKQLDRRLIEVTILRRCGRATGLCECERRSCYLKRNWRNTVRNWNIGGIQEAGTRRPSLVGSLS